MKTTTHTNWLTEFGPDFSVPEALANNPHFKDQSWGQDASPSFWTRATLARNGELFRAVIWSQHPDATQREFDGKRFLVSLAGVTAEDTDVLAHNAVDQDIMETDDISEAIKAALMAVLSPETLAREFSNILAKWLTHGQAEQVLKLNKAETNPSICHTHDFVDPNQAMIDALANLGLEFDCQNEEQGALIDAAWAIAKSNGFWFLSAEVAL